MYSTIYVLNEAVLTCTHNLCFRAKEKKILIFHSKIDIFTAVKYCSIFHGRVMVMTSYHDGLCTHQ